jgi:abnormal spindle-like microcephaly-associated protein
MNRLNKNAIKIQALWRGYTVRKHINQILHTIRTRLSCYVSTSTLGVRMRNSFHLLGLANVPLQQIIIAFIDLDKVTHLSTECCNTFVQKGAINILYTFLLNCNRSVPHIDLIKLCLKILINLVKYNETVIRIMEPTDSLFILSNLLLSYHTNNPAIYG